MKKVCTIAFALFVILAMTTSDSQAQFKNRGVYVGPNLSLSSITGFGGQIEFALSPNFGLGGLVRYWSWSGGYWSETYIIPQAQGAYHFMPNNQLDPYIGARVGYLIVSTTYDTGYSSATGAGTSKAFFTGCGGLRYFINPNISLNGSVEFLLGSYSNFGGAGFVVGVDFTL